MFYTGSWTRDHGPVYIPRRSAREGHAARAHPVPQARELQAGEGGAAQSRARGPHRLRFQVPHPSRAAQAGRRRRKEAGRIRSGKPANGTSKRATSRHEDGKAATQPQNRAERRAAARSGKKGATMPSGRTGAKQNGRPNPGKPGGRATGKSAAGTNRTPETAPHRDAKARTRH